MPLHILAIAKVRANLESCAASNCPALEAAKSALATRAPTPSKRSCYNASGTPQMNAPTSMWLSACAPALRAPDTIRFSSARSPPISPTSRSRSAGTAHSVLASWPRPPYAEVGQHGGCLDTTRHRDKATLRKTKLRGTAPKHNRQAKPG